MNVTCGHVRVKVCAHFFTHGVRADHFQAHEGRQQCLSVPGRQVKDFCDREATCGRNVPLQTQERVWRSYPYVCALESQRRTQTLEHTLLSGIQLDRFAFTVHTKREGCGGNRCSKFACSKFRTVSIEFTTFLRKLFSTNFFEGVHNCCLWDASFNQNGSGRLM